jgi:tRNA pseudouridine55 synthase
MSRRGRGRARFLADGVLVLDKPAGPTSHDAVERLRRRFGPAKLGHAGTLDPFATGVLVMAFNQATRLTDLLGLGRKVYQARLALGRATDTGDYTGTVVDEAPVPEADRAAAEAALASLVGERMQAPPSYSAAKHQGRPLYAYARQGVEVAKPPRPITVYEARLLESGPDWLEFVIACSRGTYVRALGEDLARALGTVGCLAALARIESSPFGLAEAVGLDEAQDWTPATLEERLIAPRQALARGGVPELTLSDDLAWQIQRGRILAREELLAEAPEMQTEGPFMALSPEGRLVAVLRWLAPGQTKPGRDYETIRVFPEPGEPDPGDEASASALGAE